MQRGGGKGHGLTGHILMVKINSSTDLRIGGFVMSDGWKGKKEENSRRNMLVCWFLTYKQSY